MPAPSCSPCSPDHRTFTNTLGYPYDTCTQKARGRFQAWKRPPPWSQGTASCPLANWAAVTAALNWFRLKIIRAFLGVGKGRVWIQVVARCHKQFHKNSWRRAQLNFSLRFSTVSGIWKLNSWRQMLDTGGYSLKSYHVPPSFLVSNPRLSYFSQQHSGQHTTLKAYRND